MTRPDDPKPCRRDAAVIVAVAFAGTGVLLAGWPFIAQMAPNPATPVPEPTEIDVAHIAPGQSVEVAWQSRPMLVRRRTLTEIEQSRAVGLAALVDHRARNAALPANAPATDDNRVRPGHAEWLVVESTCTREACRIAALAGELATAGEAFICPCCASRYDIAGRVRSGPAPHNLAVPAYRFTTATRLRIG